ncbi:MAG TPA: phosphatase PAP2 family protein [Burkholderiaceae bacterium]|nr:phosphatase PAP2 family protein [Burkholderiaceae bacterium]
MILWNAITFLGDTVVLLPVAIVITIWLLMERAWRMAAAWWMLFAMGLTLVAATKVAFAGWGIGIRFLDFTGLSGHAMRATAVIPVMLYLILQKSSRTARMSGMAAGVGLATLICVSRVIVRAHSVSEVVAGGLLGAMISATFIALSQHVLRHAAYRWLIAFSMAGALGTSHAQPAPTQHWINGVALYLSGRDKPFDRSSWKTAASKEDCVWYSLLGCGSNPLGRNDQQ